MKKIVSVVALCAVCVFAVSLTGCNLFNINVSQPAGTEAQTEVPTQAVEVTEYAKSESSQPDSVNPDVSTYKRITKMTDYLSEPSVKEQYDNIVNGFNKNTFSDVRFYAKDDSTAVFEYTFSQDFTTEQLASVKEKLQGQESTLKGGAKSAIREFEQYTSIPNPKIAYLYYDASGDVLFDKTYTKADVE